MDRTERLLLSRPKLSDVPSLFAFLGDPAAMQHTHCHESPRDCRRHVAAYEWQRRRLGFAPWTIRTPDGPAIGWGGLYEDPFDRGWGVEVGYFFAPAAWGKGYATEGAAAAIDWAFDHLGWTDVIHCIDPENVASQRVAERLGSTNLGPTQMPAPFEHLPVDAWGQSKSQWKVRQRG